MPSSLSIELPPRAEQTAFNLRRWAEILADRNLPKIPGRVETDRHGRIIISPPPAPEHGRFQLRIGSLLNKLMSNGEALTECAISTADGVKGADVAWASRERWRDLGKRSCFVLAPEICVEVISPDNSEEEIREKIALYLDAGAKEVWVCGAFGEIDFFGPGSTPLKASQLCPAFPKSVS
jgi:Uma2 family endonuclease